MKIISVLLVLACVCPAAQVIMRGSAGKNGVYSFHYETRVEPEIPGQKLTGFGMGGVNGGKSIRRWMADYNNKTYFGYDLSVEPEAGGMLRLSFTPLSLSANELGLKPVGGWTQIPLPHLPAPQAVLRTDTIAVEMFVHPITGQKVVDYLNFEEKELVRLANGAARDFDIRDVPLTFRNWRLTFNGKELLRSSAPVIGTAIILYVPGYGRSRISLAPDQEAGWTRGGEVRGDKLTLTSGADTLTIESDGAIAPGGGVFNVYTHFDKLWKPRYGAESVIFSATTR